MQYFAIEKSTKRQEPLREGAGTLSARLRYRKQEIQTPPPHPNQLLTAIDNTCTLGTQFIFFQPDFIDPHFSISHYKFTCFCHVSVLESSLSTENISCEVIKVIIPFNESTLKSANFLKSLFFESFSSTVTEIVMNNNIVSR